MASTARGDDPPRCGPQMPPPSVSRLGVGGWSGLSGFQRRRDRGVPRRRRRGRASELWPQDLFPLAPPIPGAPWPFQAPAAWKRAPSPSRPAPAAKLGLGGWLWRRYRQLGRTEDGALWTAGEGPRPAGSGRTRARPRPPAGENVRQGGEKRARSSCPNQRGSSGSTPKTLKLFPEPHRLIHQPALLLSFGPARPPTPFPGFGEDPWLMQKVESVAHIWPLQLWGEGIGFH